MSRSNDRIKYFSDRDMSLGWYLPMAEKKLVELDLDKPICDINDAIELHNILKMINSEARLQNWSIEYQQELRRKASSAEASIGRYFSGITNDNFISILGIVEREYEEDIWYLFNFYKLHNRIHEDVISLVLENNPYVLRTLLQQRGIVDAYSELLTKHFMSSVQYAEILIDEYLSEHLNSIRRAIFLPDALTTSKREELITEYINWEESNPNYLRLIFESRDINNLPIKVKTKRLAKQQYDSRIQKLFANKKEGSSGLSFEIIFDNNCEDAIKSHKTTGTQTSIVYGKKWIENNLDYPTLWNNFIYMFEFVDIQSRCTFVSNPTKQPVILRAMSIHGKSTYHRSMIDGFTNNLDNHILMLYREVLHFYNINIEEMITWFFSTYLIEEFQVEGFVFNAPSDNTTYLEKCKILATEIDSVLKQFDMYVKDGYIDRGLFEFTSDSMKIENIRSMIQRKYFYADSSECFTHMYNLFSDQSTLSYTQSTKKEYPSLFKLLRHKKVYRTDFHDYNLPSIDSLIKANYLVLSNDLTLKLNKNKVFVLQDLYINQVSFRPMFKDFEEELSEMEMSSDIRFSSTLFSEPEQDYLSYVLTQSKFSNGLDLRNRYIHGNYPSDTKQHENDYFEFLKTLVFIVIKINQEFCYRD